MESEFSEVSQQLSNAFVFIVALVQVARSSDDRTHRAWANRLACRYTMSVTPSVRQLWLVAA
ncbi:hypothetical protein NS14008_18305 [Nocardia seriolae]|nr:hypothetical protein NS14008_18305 [Nocardia seriolae]PSK31960.1 hypothetical protein C6575_07520 [Nocardia seriolae]RLP32257.1 hypothetical protein D6158_08705 [Nocardia seriolae]